MRKNLLIIFLALSSLAIAAMMSSCSSIKKIIKPAPDTTVTYEKYDGKNAPIKKLRKGLLKTGKYEYNATLELKGEIYNVKLFREIKFQKDYIILTEDIHTAIGKSTDRFMVDTATLLPFSRVAYEGIDEVLKLVFSKKAVSGYTVDDMGQTNVNVDIKSPVFSDGFNLELAITLMPLDEGYRNTVKYYDFRLDDIRTAEIEVPAIDEIQSFYGNFKCYRVFVHDPDLNTLDIYWVSTDGIPKIIKAETEVPTDFGKRRKAFELVNIY